MEHKQTILITGGHISPALALIDALRKFGSYSVIFAGRKYALEGQKIMSVEYQLISERNIPFIPIITGRLQRRFTLYTIPSLLKIPTGFFQALRVCLMQRPALIVSFGGYIGLPVAIAAWVCGIPVITHEQTFIPGLANRIIARIAIRVCVTFPETINYFPAKKAIYTGLPIRDELFRPPETCPFPPVVAKYPLIYITGGSTGAQSINRLIFPIVPVLLRKYSIVHQVGEVSLPAAQQLRESLPAAYRNRYLVQAYVPMPVLSWVLIHAFLVAGRSGANTVMELAVLGKVGIFVPLPWSGGGEQLQNAAWLSRNGGAAVIMQNKLTSEIFLKQIESVIQDIKALQIRAASFALQIPRDGTKRLMKEIEHITNPTA